VRQGGPILPHLSLEPVCRRGWGSVYAALARGEVDAERLRDLLASHLPPADPLVFAVDVTTWPRCDAECSPGRGYYYHPSRHSAGQPIIAGWAYQWICQLGFDRDWWTAPVDARRLHPLRDTDQAAAGQIRVLLARLDAGGRVPLFVLDGGYDAAQLPLDLATERVAVLVGLRCDRCCYADPPPAAHSPKGVGRAAMAPSSTAPTRPPGPLRPPPWYQRRPGRHGDRGGLGGAAAHPAAPPGHGSGGPRPIVRGTISASRSSGSPPAPARQGAVVVGAGPGGLDLDLGWRRTSAGSTWSTPSGSVSRPLAGRPHDPAIPSRPTAGPGWCWPVMRSCV
jgi:hypothetical protein